MVELVVLFLSVWFFSSSKFRDRLLTSFQAPPGYAVSLAGRTSGQQLSMELGSTNLVCALFVFTGFKVSLLF